MGQPSNCRSVFFLYIGLLSLLALHEANVRAELHWDDEFTASGDCIAPGYMKYSSKLMEIDGDWDNVCKSTPATADGIHFVHPDHCQNGVIGEWGELYVRDGSCNPQWGAFADRGCRDGRHRFESVLLGVPFGESWEQWCDNAWAEISGVFFLQPTKCRNDGGFQMFGEFDILDPCCAYGTTDRSAAVSAHQHQHPRRLLDANTCMLSNSNGGTPPYDMNGFPKTLLEAVDAFAADHFNAQQLATYLYSMGSYQRSQFFVSTETSGGIQSYDVSVSSTCECLSFNPSGMQANDNPINKKTITAISVPHILATELKDKNTIPTFSWYDVTISVSSARIITVGEVSGCCFIFGWDNGTQTLYMANVKPDPQASEPYLQTAKELENHLRQQSQLFEGIHLDKIYQINSISENYGGYGATGEVHANVIGLLEHKAIHIVVQFVNSKGFIDKSRYIQLSYSS